MARYVCSVAGALIIALGTGMGVAAQATSGQQSTPQVKVGRIVPIQSVDGRDNFITYCAVCHGVGAKGDGPAAPALKATPADLTRIAVRNGGKFNAVRVDEIIRTSGKIPTPAHGVETMPIWGEAFRAEDKAKSTLRITNLVKYLESIQVRAPSSSR